MSLKSRHCCSTCYPHHTPSWLARRRAQDREQKTVVGVTGAGCNGSVWSADWEKTGEICQKDVSTRQQHREEVTATQQQQQQTRTQTQNMRLPLHDVIAIQEVAVVPAEENFHPQRSWKKSGKKLSKRLKQRFLYNHSIYVRCLLRTFSWKLFIFYFCKSRIFKFIYFQP